MKNIISFAVCMMLGVATMTAVNHVGRRIMDTPQSRLLSKSEKLMERKGVNRAMLKMAFAPQMASANQNLRGDVDVFVYSDQDTWVADGNMTYSYNNAGLPTILFGQSSEGGCFKILYTYDEKGRQSEIVMQVSEDGTNYTDFVRQTLEYDPVVADKITKIESSDCLFGDWSMGGFKYEIKRDAQGRVVENAYYETFEADTYQLVSKHTIAYDASGNVAEVEFQEMDSYTGEVASVLTLKNVEFADGTDCQFVDNFMEWTKGANKLTKADIFSEGANAGSVSATYTDSKSELTVDLAKSRGSLIKYARTETEFGGLITETGVYVDYNEDGVLTDDELAQYSKHVTAFDAQGNQTLNEEYDGGYLSDGEKHEFKYADNGAIEEEVVSYNENGNVDSYRPETKFATTSYVAAGQGSAVLPQVAGEEITGVYTLQGVRVGEAVDNLAPGFYIVKKGAKAEKVMIGR